MSGSRFFPTPEPITLAQAGERVNAELVRGDGSLMITGLAPLHTAGRGDITFLDSPKFADKLAATEAAACLCTTRYAGQVPDNVAVLGTAEPYRAFARLLAEFFPHAMRFAGAYDRSQTGIAQAANVHPSASVEAGARIEPGAVIGEGAQIGAGTVIGANTVIGSFVAIGRDCSVAPNAVIGHALIGNGVIIHAGAKIGEDGFGFSMGAQGHLKIPQIGRVIIQDDVEIGANTTIDRGSMTDTVIGEGTKIDNLVQIGHNVVLGRHCVVVAQAGISGSAEIGDHVVMGGQSGFAGHIKVGSGAMIAGASNAKDDIPAGGRYGGIPAKPLAEWARELVALKRLGRRGPK